MGCGDGDGEAVPPGPYGRSVVEYIASMALLGKSRYVCNFVAISPRRKQLESVAHNYRHHGTWYHH